MLLLALHLPQVAAMAGDGPDKLRTLDKLAIHTEAAHDMKFTAAITYLPNPGANFTVIGPAQMIQMGIRKAQLCGRGVLPTPTQAEGGPGKLRPLGFFRGWVQFQDLAYEEDIYVLKGLHGPLLSKWACLALGIYVSLILDAKPTMKTAHK
jgi:hypothetical protein